MNLKDFERFIDSKILDRGRRYFKEGRVLSIEETAANAYTAEVDGTELYVIYIQLDSQGTILDIACDCPYDIGEYCKHQVAALLALRKLKTAAPDKDGNQADSQPVKSGAKSAGRKAKKAPDICRILATRTKEELITFLIKLADEDESIGERLALDFGGGNDAEELKRAAKLIRACINRNADRRGFVDYKSAYAATEGARQVLDKARSQLQNYRPMQALALVLCVIHAMMALLPSVDDSDGFVGEEIDVAMRMIKEIIQLEYLTSDDKAQIFIKLASEATDTRYDGWSDWQLDFIEYCVALADTQALQMACENLLAQAAQIEDGTSWSGSYYTEKVNLIRYKMITMHGSPKQAQEFVTANLQYSAFREMTIESALENKNFDLAERLALDGEALDHDKRGLVKRWREYRYAAYSRSGNLEKQRALAMDFVLDGSFEYYMDLKRSYATDEWRSVYPKIIARMENQKGYLYSNVYTQILIEEAEKQKLYAWLKCNLSSIGKYYRHLMPEFKEEVYTLFVQHIAESAQAASDRNAYQKVCASIRKLRKAGGKEQAAQIKQQLMEKYPRRPAFQDELSKV